MSARTGTTRPGLGIHAAAVATVLLAALAAAPAASATEVRHFRTNTQASFLAGTLEGISVDPLGRLRLADRAERLTAIGEPFLLSAAVHPDGWVVGTGNAGRVLAIGRDGAVRELFAAPEPEIFAVLADPDGTVWAASSPGGKIYRIPPGGGGEVFFDPGEVYVWALARAADGALLAATGTQGKLYRIDAEGHGEAVFDSDDSHLRSLAVLPGGDVVVGTAGEGLVIRLTPPGGSSGAGAWRARTLYDAAEPEVVALAAGPGGRVFAALVASEASRLDLAARPRSAAADEDDEDDEGGDGGEGATVTVTVSESGEPMIVGSRPSGFSGPRSEVMRIGTGGRVERVWSFEGDTVYDLLWLRDRLWVATGLEGKLYSFDGGEMVLEKDVDDSQVVALVPGDPGPAFATTNAAAFYRLSGGTERQGVYTSAALDARQMARFGVLRWRGAVPAGGGLEVSFRSGVSGEPDRTWSDWTPWRPAVRRGGAGGRDAGEVALEGVPPGRYVQWRARLIAADGDSPQLYEVELSYLQENLEPRIDRLTVMDPGEILVPAAFNPSNQAFEPVGPNREGIFTTLEPADEGESRSKTLWKKGWRTLRWKAGDDNGDSLVYALGFAAAEGDDGWMPMVDELDEDHYSFDSAALPDGVWRFRLTASDRPDNPGDRELAAERVSEPVVIDNAAPRLDGVARQGGGLRVTVADDWSPLRSAELSVDAGEWRPAAPADGLLDGRREELAIAPPEGARLLLLRVTDAAFNTVTFDLSGELR